MAPKDILLHYWSLRFLFLLTWWSVLFHISLEENNNSCSLLPFRDWSALLLALLWSRKRNYRLFSYFPFNTHTLMSSGYWPSTILPFPSFLFLEKNQYQSLLLSLFCLPHVSSFFFSPNHFRHIWSCHVFDLTSQSMSLLWHPTFLFCSFFSARSVYLWSSTPSTGGFVSSERQSFHLLPLKGTIDFSLFFVSAFFSHNTVTTMTPKHCLCVTHGQDSKGKIILATNGM